MTASKPNAAVRHPLSGQSSKTGGRTSCRRELAKTQEESLIGKQLLATRAYAEAVIKAVPPLLIMDQRLRVQTANESFCECFKTEGAALPVVVLTASQEDSDITVAYRLGANGFLVKPFEASKFEEMVSGDAESAVHPLIFNITRIRHDIMPGSLFDQY